MMIVIVIIDKPVHWYQGVTKSKRRSQEWIAYLQNFISPGELDPLNRRQIREDKPDVVVQGKVFIYSWVWALSWHT